jgi:hypothetical protein
MPLTSQLLPIEELNALQRDLSSFKSVDATTADWLVSAAQNPASGYSTEVFTLGVPDILPGGGGLAAAMSGGWRLSGAYGTKPIACDMYTVARGGPQPLPQGSHRLACVRTGEPVNKLLTAIASLQQPGAMPPDTPFLLRLLIMPALFTDALWLLPSSLDPASSRLIAYDTLIETFTPGTQYSPADFIQRLLPVAQYWQQYKPPPAPQARSREKR